ncbi:hypothetical protein Tco_0570915 [Tanacetum coccineum]
MSTLKFAENHNLVAFLEKPKESNGFDEIIDFLNTSSVQYALTVNPTIYTTCIEQFWTSGKAKTVWGTVSVQSLVSYKEELERIGTMASAIICLATNKNFNFSKYIFDNMVKNLEGGVKFLMYPRFVQVFLDKQVEGMSRHKGIYVIPSHTKKVFANMKRPGKGFSRKVTPLFETMMVQATEDMGEDSAAPTDSHSTPIHTQPSSSKPQKKKSRRKQRKDSGPTEPIPDEAINEEHVATPSCDPPQSGKDRMQLTELMDLCTQLQSRVLALETTKSNQALEIESLKRRVKSLEKRRKSRTPGAGKRKLLKRKVSVADLVSIAGDVVTTVISTKSNQALEIESLKRRVKSLEKIRKLRTPGFKRLRKDASASRVESSNDVSLDAQEDVSKKGRKIIDPDADAEVTLVDETQEINDDNLMFDTGVLEEQEKEVAKKEVSDVDPVTTVGEVLNTANVEATTANAPTTTIDELTLAQTLIEIKAAKPKAATSAATTTTTTRPKARGVVVQEPSKFKTTSSPLQASQLPQAKDKGKAKMEMFDKEMKRVNTFVDMNTELVKSSKTRSEGSSKRAGDEHESDNLKKQKIDEHVEAKKDDDQEEAEMKKHIKIVKDDEVNEARGAKDTLGILFWGGPIPGMTSAQALTAIQIMADHSQKWHDGTTSRNIRISSGNDGLATLDCPLNEEVKQVEEVRYGEFGRTTPFNESHGGNFHVASPGYYTKTNNRPPYGERRPSLEELLTKHQEESTRRSPEMEVWIKKLQENAEINTRNQSASLKNLETQIKQLTKELHSRGTKSK